MTGKIDQGKDGAGSRWRLLYWAGAVLLLLLPLGAAQVSDEVAWSPADFAIAAILLFGTGIAYELLARAAGNRSYRVASALALGGALLLVWLSIGVGVIGSDGDPANLLYFGVLAVGVAGAVIGAFRPAGMARALVAMAGAQVLVAVTALVAGWGTATTWWPLDIVGLTVFFAALWLVAAGIFRKAARAGA